MFNMMKENFQNILQELINDIANLAFGWIQTFMIKPMDMSDIGTLQPLYNIVDDLAYSLCIVFVGFSIIKMMISQVAGTESRSFPEIIVKTVMAGILSAAAPWLLENVLLKLNNAIVSTILQRGLNTKSLEEFATTPNGATITFFFAGLVISVLFLLLSFQYIQRMGEYIVLFVVSPIAAISIITESFDIWSVWWREAVSVIFTQSLQVGLLWVVLNLLTGTEKLSDYVFAIALMVIVLKGPSLFRQYLYSTGTGRMVAGTVGGASKMAIYKYFGAKMTGK